MAGAAASPASDVYAATATFYECLAGRPPFGEGPSDLVRQHRAEPVPLDPVPSALRPLLAAGMAKDPERRPTDARTFVRQLETAASGAYGRNWQNRGRSHLGEAALLLAALWPVGAPDASQGTAVDQVRLRRHFRLRHLSPVKAIVGAGVVISVAAAGTALATTGSSRPSPAGPPAPVQAISLQPSSPASSPSPPSPTAPTDTSSSPDSPATGPATSGPASGPLVGGSAASASAHPRTSASATVTSSSPPAKPAVPQITSAGTYTQGVFVYFDIHYANPGDNAEGFGFAGVRGSGWAEENHPFTSPSYGIVGTDSIAYPFNEGCGTAQQYDSYVEAWIYDKAGDRSTSVVIHLVCSG